MKENKKNVVVAGHICLDIIPKMLTEANVINDILRPGKLVNVGNARIPTGGSVSNTGLALNCLGINVKLMGKCGCQ